MLQEKLREHLAEKEKLSERRLEQEEKLKARIRRLVEEKEVGGPYLCYGKRGEAFPRRLRTWAWRPLSSC